MTIRPIPFQIMNFDKTQNGASKFLYHIHYIFPSLVILQYIHTCTQKKPKLLNFQIFHLYIGSHVIDNPCILVVSSQLCAAFSIPTVWSFISTLHRVRVISWRQSYFIGLWLIYCSFTCSEIMHLYNNN